MSRIAPLACEQALVGWMALPCGVWAVPFPRVVCVLCCARVCVCVVFWPFIVVLFSSPSFSLRSFSRVAPSSVRASCVLVSLCSVCSALLCACVRVLRGCVSVFVCGAVAWLCACGVPACVLRFCRVGWLAGWFVGCG